LIAPVVTKDQPSTSAFLCLALSMPRKSVNNPNEEMTLYRAFLDGGSITFVRNAPRSVAAGIASSVATGSPNLLALAGLTKIVRSSLSGSAHFTTRDQSAHEAPEETVAG
jgi:hypothetical protein